jgi:hypothetical protein
MALCVEEVLDGLSWVGRWKRKAFLGGIYLV